MISLFLDTSNFRLIVGVVDESNNNIITMHNEKLHGDLSTKVFEIIDLCISNANIKPTDIKKIYSVIGPGSFTGVRIGVTIAKTFAWARNIKVIPVSSLEVLATTETDKDFIIPMIDARRGCVYAGIYDKKLNPVIDDAYISLESLKNNLPSGATYSFISDDNIEYFDSVEESNVDIIKIINKHKNEEGVNPHHLNPEYLKMTEAEANLLNKENDSRD